MVVAIIAIMSAVGFASLQSAKSASRLKTAKREVAATIKLAQSYALQGKMQNGATPCGYGFRFPDNDNVNYEIFYNPGPDCDKKNSGTDLTYLKKYLHYTDVGILPASQTAESFSLKNGVTLVINASAPGNANREIYFTVPRANIFNGVGAPYPEIQSFWFEYSGDFKMIIFNPGGYVTEN